VSQENVEKVQAYLATWDRELLRPESRPFERINSTEAAVALYASDALYEDSNLPDHVGEVYRGLDSFSRAGERWIEDCKWLLVELEQIIDAGDRVVSTHRARMKMRHTGIEFESPLAYVFTFREGKVVHLRSFVDPAEALAAVGLAE
jgi:ketosteroid isomerase-like protein